MDWNHHHFRLALSFAERSPDPSTQNGAVLSGDQEGVMVACNEFPSGVSYTPERWERPLKYSFIEHAERNVIFEAARKGYRTQGATLLSPWAACADCARAIIQAGIVQLVRFDNHGPNERWDESIAIGDTMMREAGVEIVELKKPAPGTFGITLRRNGALLEF